MLAAIVILAAAVWGAKRLSGVEVVWARLVRALPLIGSVFEHSAIAQFAQVLSMLVRQHVPLPDALRLAAEAMRDPSFKRGCRDLAEELQRGTPPERAVRRTPELPVELEQVFRWSDRGEGFADLLQAAGQTYRLRAQLDARTVVALVEPLLIAGIGIVVALMVTAMFLPLINLLNELS